MPTLKTPRHEAFCKGMASGLNRTESASAAGYAESRARITGSELGGRADIRARISELGKQIDAVFSRNAGKTSYTRVDALKRADLAFQVAQEKKNAAAMVAAVSLEAKLCGLLVEKTQEIKGIEEYSDAELDKLMASFEAGKAIRTATLPDDEAT